MSKPTHEGSEFLEKNKRLVRNFIEGTSTRHDITTADKYLGQNNPIRHNQQVMGTERFKEEHR
jgi:hypothetical protein